MTKKPWRSYILAEQDGIYIMSGGNSQGISEGSQFKVFSLGAVINNPQTGAKITLPGKKVAEISVIGTFGEDEFNEISYVQIVNGTLTKDLTKYYVTQ